MATSAIKMLDSVIKLIIPQINNLKIKITQFLKHCAVLSCFHHVQLFAPHSL